MIKLWFLVLATTAYCRVVHDTSISVPLRGHALSARQTVIQDNPACLAYCELDTCGGSSCSLPSRRSVIHRDFNGNNTYADTDTGNPLFKRVFSYVVGGKNFDGNRPTTEQVRTYLPAVLNDSGDHGYYGAPIGLIMQNDERPYGREILLEEKPFQIQNGGLHGCTVVTMVSKNAVWSAHFWEVYSNGRIDPEFLLHDTPGDKAFEQRVLDFILGKPLQGPPAIQLNGDSPYLPPGGDSPTAGLYNNAEDNTQVFIMTPIAFNTDPKDQIYLYPNRLNEIKETFKTLLGFYPPLSVFGYQRLDYTNPQDQGLIDKTERGLSLFQYDPNSNTRKKAAWRLFYEDSYYRSTYQINN